MYNARDNDDSFSERRSENEYKAKSEFNPKANGYSRYDFLRQLRGVQRTNWLLGLDGKRFYEMSPEERDVTLSIISNRSIEELHKMDDLEHHAAISAMEGVSEKERETVLDILRRREIKRVEIMEDKVRAFLKDPYSYMPNVPKSLQGRSWDHALRALDLLNISLERRATEYQKIGRPEKLFRKNGLQPEKIHFLEPILDFIESFKDGTLPYRVPSINAMNEFGQKIGRKKMPLHEHSAEHLVTLFLLHDLVEDDDQVTIDSIGYDLEQGLDNNLSAEEREFALKEIEFIKNCLRSITFKHKIRMPDGSIMNNVSDHKNADGEPDLNVYSRDMWPYWPALIGKGKDRKNGLKGRHSSHILAEDFFDIKDDTAYLEDTESVLVHGQLLEKAQTMFPALSKYVDAINAQLEVVFRNFEFVTRNHPRAEVSEKRKAKRISAELDISKYAMNIAKTSNYHLKFSDIREQYYSMVIESMRHPDLRHAIQKIGGQLHYFLGEGMKADSHAEVSLGRGNSNDNVSPGDGFDHKAFGT